MLAEQYHPPVAGLAVSHETAEINGFRMHYARAGQGPLMLMLHGFPDFWYSWRKLMPALAERYTVVAPDQRGYNASGRPGWGYGVDVLAADVVGLIEHLGERRAILVGHDWGGAVAWATALSYPHRIERLVVLNAPHPSVFVRALRESRAQRRRSAYMGFFALPWLPELALRAGDYAFIDEHLGRRTAPGAFTAEDLAHYKDALSRPGALTAALNWYRAAAYHQASGLSGGRGSRVSVPTLLIWGERDRYLGAEMIAGHERYVPDLTVHRIPEATHWVQHERPDEVLAAMGAFLARP